MISPGMRSRQTGRSIVPSTTRRTGVITVCFALSGFAGLLYETVWFRQFASVFGTSEAALGAVLAGYMGGLALGAALAGRWTDRVRRPVLAYGLLELGVALGALLIPWGLQAAAVFRVWLCGGQDMPPDAGGAWEVLLNTSLTFALMLLPTTCMGATLPMLARDLDQGSTNQRGQLAKLYGWNTCGAVIGTLTTAFLILPQFGLFGALMLGAGVNVIVFLLVLTQRAGNDDVESGAMSSDQQLAAATTSRPTSLPAWMVVVVTVSSLLAFAYEIAWTRLLSHVLGGSVFSFATMLSAFLIGITLGSWWISRTVLQRRDMARLMTTAQSLTAFGTSLAFALCGLLPHLARWIDTQALWGGGLVSLLVLLPSTIGIGMTLPLAIEAYGAESRIAGRLLAASTLGAIAGSLLCGHWLLPLLGFRGLFVAGVSIQLVLALVLYRRSPEIDVTTSAPAVDLSLQGHRQRVQRATGMALGALVLLVSAQPDSLLRSSPLLSEPLKGRAVYMAVGSSSTVALIEQAGEFRLATNGLPESVIARRGAVAGSEAGLRWLTALPVLARPHAKSVLIVGLGGGGAVSGVPASVDEIHAVELEPEVIKAIRSVSQQRLDDPLSDPRLKVIHNDARAALALTQRRYDIIVSQPSHPWTAGASHIYTREFLQLARERLSDEGVFLQWMDASFVDATLLKTMGATLLDSFEHTRLYQPHPGTLLFLASRQPLNVEEDLLRTREPLQSHPERFRWLGLNDVTDVAAALCLDHAGLQAFCAGASINTDNRNRLAMQALQRRASSGPDSLSELLQAHDPLVSRADQPSLVARLSLDSTLVVRRLLRTQFNERAARVVESLPNPVDQRKGRGLVALSKGDASRAREQFVEVMLARPNDRWSRFKLLEPMLQLAGNPQAPREFVQLVSMTKSVERAVVEAARRYQQRDFAGMSSLEGELALARPTEAYYPQALLFRGLWRAKVTKSSRKEELGLEAIDLADRALAVESSLFGALVRLWASQNASSADHYLESAAYVIDIINRQPQSMSAANAKQLAKQVHQELDRIAAESLAHQPRVAEIRALYQVLESSAASAHAK